MDEPGEKEESYGSPQPEGVAFQHRVLLRKDPALLLNAGCEIFNIGKEDFGLSTLYFVLGAWSFVSFVASAKGICRFEGSAYTKYKDQRPKISHRLRLRMQNRLHKQQPRQHTEFISLQPVSGGLRAIEIGLGQC